MDTSNKIAPNQLGLVSLKNTRAFIGANQSRWLYLSLVGMSIPVLLFELLLASFSLTMTHDIKMLTLAGQASDLPQLLGKLADYLLPFFALLLPLGLVMSTVYLNFVRICSPIGQDESISESLKKSLSLTLTKGIWLALLILVILFVFKGFLFLFFVLTALSAMTPVLASHVKERSVFGILKDAFTLAYTEKRTPTKWGPLFQLVSYSACLLFSFLLINAINGGILFLDDYIGGSRSPYVTGLLFDGLSGPYLLGLLVRSTASALIVSFFAIFTTQYYLLITGDQLSSEESNEPG